MLNAESLAIHAPYSPNISSNGILGIKVTQGSWLSPSATTHANTGSKTGDSSAFDFGLVRDTKILSMAFGIVVAVEGNWDDGTFIKHSWGNYVTVLHVAPRLDGTGVEVFYATYAHLGKAERPNVLDFVNAGDIIGHVGETGESHGAHLHVQIGTERDGTMADGSPTPENQALLERLFFVGYQYDENGTRVDLTPLSQLDEGEYVRSVNGIQTVIEPIPNSDGVGGVGDVADLAFAFVGLGDDFANKGSSIDFIANVENLGDLSSGQTSVRLVITSTPEDSSSWRELGDFSIDALSNASGLNSIDYLSSSFDLPNDLVGDFFVGFIIDPDDNVPEVHEWNNINWSPITVVDPNNSFVDLMGLDVDVDGNTFDVGDTFEFTVDYTNLGNGLAGYFDIAVYLSPTESTEDGILLFEETGFETPDPGETLTEYFNAYTNGKWYSGTYNILVEFDSGDDIAEPNDANNVAMGTIYLNGITPKPDVAFSGYSSGTANRTLEQGGTFSTYFEVTNSNFGQSDFGGPTSAQIVFSADQNISNDDIFLGDFHIPDLSVGENVVFLNAEVALPSNMTLGDYYVAVVLDPDDLINEVYEDNNTAWYTHTFEVVAPASLPDMSVSNLEVVLRSDGSGLYDATFTVHNNGGDLQGAGVILRLSPTQNISWENSYALGGDVTGSLDSGNSVELSISGVDLDWVQNYSGFTPGTYYFAVEVDYSGFVDELNELNNISNLVAIELELPVLSSSGVLGETGTLTLNHTASTVTLQHSYDNPVVIAFIATENGNQPVNVRVTDIGGDQLSLQLQEPNYLDGSHAKETVHYLVVEAGTWVLPNGTLLEAGTLTSNQLSSQGFESVAFDAEFDTAPVLLSQVQTDNGGDFVTTRQTGTNADGFQITMQEEEALNSGAHVTETIGWVAIEPGSGSSGGFDWIAGHATGVTDTNSTVSLTGSIADGANVVASLASFSGGDSAWVRGNGSTTNGFDISVEEETSLNAETSHVAETVDYFVFNGAQTISAAPIQQVLETGTLTLNHTASTVTLQHSYDNPVVISFIATENGNQPVNVRVTDIGGDQLSLQLQEPNYLDGSHAKETVHYLVVEAGTWVLPNGTLLEAGTLTSNQLSSQGFESVAFDAEFDTAPVLLSQVQTDNGGDFVTTRQTGTNADGFQITMQEEEALNSGAHVTETIGWVAIEPGSGSSGGLDWLAGHATGVTDTNSTVSLTGSFAGGANVVASLASFSGGDSAWLRGNGSTTNGFDISVEEETSLNAESSHVAETVDYFVFNGTAVVSAYDYDLFV